MSVSEQNLIGCLLIDDTDYAISRVYDTVSADMFYSHEIYRRVYLEYQKAYENHRPIDSALVRQTLLDDGYSEKDIEKYLVSAVKDLVTSANIEQYAENVVRRHIATRFNRIISDIKKPKPSIIYQQISDLQNQLNGLLGEEESGLKTLPEIVEKYKGDYFKPHEPRIMLGFKGIDEIVGGLEKGDLTVIGARPAVGKSAFITQVVSWLGKNGKKVAFYNLEMTDRQVYERFLVNESGLGLSYLRNSESCTKEEYERFKEANEILARQEFIRIVDDGAKTVRRIETESRHMEYDLIVVDYLQLLSPEETYKGNRRMEIGEISRGLKMMAKSLNLPVVALSQLNRASEGRESREPSMSELREAGDIEQDASVIILLWNMDDDDHDIKGCKIAKNRQGRTGKVVLHFNGDLMRFEEMDEDAGKIEKRIRRSENATPFDRYTQEDYDSIPFK